MDTSVKNDDVVFIILQYLLELGYRKAFSALKEESGAPFNVLIEDVGFDGTGKEINKQTTAASSSSSNDTEKAASEGKTSVGSLFHDLRSLILEKGDYATLIQSKINHFSLNEETASKLYELVILELLESDQVDVAEKIFNESPSIQSIMKISYPFIFERLKKLIARSVKYIKGDESSTKVPLKELYPPNGDKVVMRRDLVNALENEVVDAPPHLMLSLIEDALKWRRYEGRIASLTSKSALSKSGVAKYDLVKNHQTSLIEQSDVIASKRSASIKVGGEAAIQSWALSFDGQSLAIGCTNGLIEVRDTITWQVREDLDYQKQNEKQLKHIDSIISLCFSPDSELVASGCTKGMIKVWRLSNGKCLRTFDMGNTGTSLSNGISCLAFSPDGRTVAAATSGGIVKLYGLVSGSLLSELRGHASDITRILYFALPYVKPSDKSTKVTSVEGENLEAVVRIITSSNDGTVKLWDPKGNRCLYTYKPSFDQSIYVGSSIANVILIPNFTGIDDQNDFRTFLLIVSRSKRIHLVEVFSGIIGPNTICTFSLPTATKSDRASNDESSTSASSSKKTKESEDSYRFIDATISRSGGYVYAISEDGYLHIYDKPVAAIYNAGKMDGTIIISEPKLLNSVALNEFRKFDLLGVLHHPHQNNVLVFNSRNIVDIMSSE